jgi:hypothetical protein
MTCESMIAAELDILEGETFNGFTRQED